MGRMDDDILKVLYTEEEIAARIREMGAAMYRTEPLIRVMVEAKTVQQAEECAGHLADLVKTLKI